MLSNNQSENRRLVRINQKEEKNVVCELNGKKIKKIKKKYKKRKMRNVDLM